MVRFSGEEQYEQLQTADSTQQARPVAPCDSPDIVPVGKLPPLGVVPKKMHRLRHSPRALRRAEGELRDRRRSTTPPSLGPDEVLVWVMAAGVNYNNVWAGLGTPVDVLARARRAAITWRPRRLRHRLEGRHRRHPREGRRRGRPALRPWACGHVSLRQGGDPMFGQLPRSGATRPAGAASPSSPRCRPSRSAQAQAPLVGRGRELRPHATSPPTACSWLGARQAGRRRARLGRRRRPRRARGPDRKVLGANAIAVVSSDERGKLCKKLGAKGCIQRKFDHWGLPPDWRDRSANESALRRREASARPSGRLSARRRTRISCSSTWASRRFPRCVPGESRRHRGLWRAPRASRPHADLRYLWMHQKRLRARTSPTRAGPRVQRAGRPGSRAPGDDPSVQLRDIPHAHQLMHQNEPLRQRVLPGAARRVPGLKHLAETVAAIGEAS